MSESANVQAQTVKIRLIGLAEEQLAFSAPDASVGIGQNDTVIVEMEPEAWLQEIDAVLARAELGIVRENIAMTELLERLTLADA
jgi:hypothetical protein